MKRLFKLFGILLALVLMYAVPVKAEDIMYAVDDQAGVVTASEAEALSKHAQQVAEAHDFGVYIAVLPGSVSSYGNYDYIEQLAEYMYDNSDVGVGSEKEGIFLLLTMEDGYFDIFVPHSERCDGAFSEYAREQMASTVVYDYLYNDDFYGAFESFISIVDTDLSYYEAGTPLSPSFDPAREEEIRQEEEAREASTRAAKTAATVGIPPVTALLACLGMKSKNKTAGIKHEANNYIAKNGIHMTVVQDLFLHRSETRTRIHHDDNRGGGGGGFHSSSTSMGSHTSGSFHH